MSDSSLDLLLRVAGGGKRGRSSFVTVEEKIVLAEHALQGVISQLPTLGIKVYDDMVKQALEVVGAIRDNQDDTFVVKSIETMSEASLKGIKELQIRKRLDV